MSEVHIYYLPTYLADKEPGTSVSLIVRLYQKYKSKSGKSVTKYASDVFKYDTPQDMADDIARRNMRELPIEAETDPSYIPARHKSQINRRVQSLVMNTDLGRLK